jgi:steroid delta-isomerase-like uncharacterized protein/uncharacterized protein (TIGR02246 family)
MRTPVIRSLVLPLLLAGAACGGADQVIGPVTPPPPPPTTATPTASVVVEPPAPPPKLSLADQQKLALKTAIEALNGHDAKKFASVYADDAFISVAGANDVTGRAQIEANMAEWFQTFSQVKLGFSRVWMKDDVIVIEWVINGTHSGELMGVKGTQEQIGHAGLSVVTFGDGKGVLRENRYGDLGAVATQIGAAKGAKARPVPPIPSTTETIVATSSADEAKNVELAKAMFSAIEKKSEKDFVAALADDVELEGFIHLAPVDGKEEAKKFFKAVTTAFPDAKFDVKRAWGLGDYVIAEYELTGTHKGALGQIKPTNRKVAIEGVDVMKMKGGKLSRAWTYTNGLQLMTQLGMFEPGAPPKDASAPKAGAAPTKDAPRKEAPKR